MEHHPDVSNSSCSEKFKQISEAHRVLSSARERQVYDVQMAERFRWGGANNMQEPRGSHRSSFNNNRYASGPKSQAGSYAYFVETAYKPRNILTGVALGIGVVTAYQFISNNTTNTDTPSSNNTTNHTNTNNLVEAWKNPKSGQWEQPAPWDETYRTLKPTLQLVPRDKVRQRNI